MAVHDIPESKLDVIARGLEGDTGGLADEVCRVETGQTGLSGTFTNVPTGTLMPQDDNRDLKKGDSAVPSDMTLGMVSYECSHHKGFRRVYDSDIIEADGIDFDAVEEGMKGAMMDAGHYVDRDLYDHITNGNKIQKDSPAGDLADDSNSAFAWIDSLFEAAPGADQMILGRKASKTLRAHVEFQDRFGYTGNSRLKKSELEEFLVDQWNDEGLEKVVFVGSEKFFNSADAEDTVSIAYPMDKSVYLGHSRDLFLIDPSADENRTTERQRDGDASAWKLYYDRYADVLTANSQLHVYGNVDGS